MSWLDIVLGVLLLGAAALEMSRGFGRAVFDALALYGALWLSDTVSSLLDAGVLHSDPMLSHGCTFGLLFGAFGALSFLLARFVYHSTLFHAGMFEGLLGMGAGIAVGMILCHAVVRLIVLTDVTKQGGALLVAESFLGNEMLQFTTYHSILETLSGATAAHREVPNVAG